MAAVRVKQTILFFTRPKTKYLFSPELRTPPPPENQMDTQPYQQ